MTGEATADTVRALARTRCEREFPLRRDPAIMRLLGAAHFGLVSSEQRQRIRERMRLSLLAGRRAVR